LTENGDITEKYSAIRNAIGQYRGELEWRRRRKKRRRRGLFLMTLY